MSACMGVPLEEARGHGAVAAGRDGAEPDAAPHAPRVLLQHLHEDGAAEAGGLIEGGWEGVFV